MELYNELRENWERVYWDEGYSKKLAQDHANYDSPEDDDEDFNPYRFVGVYLFYHCIIRLCGLIYLLKENLICMVSLCKYILISLLNLVESVLIC